jgi:dipeptidyl-peptidase-4
MSASTQTLGRFLFVSSRFSVSRFAFVLLLALLAGCQARFAAPAEHGVTREGKRRLTLAEAMDGLGAGGGFDGRSSADGRHYTRLEAERRIVEYDYATGEPSGRVLFDLDGVTSPVLATFGDYERVEGSANILITSGVQRIYRHSFTAAYYIYDGETKRLEALSERPRLQLAKLSPDGSKVAFVSENDLYVKDLATGRETAVTTDGEPGEIFNGIPDWVYEEEFGMLRAFDWAPDGSAIAFLRFDARRVPSYPLIEYEGLYPRVVQIRYPKAGEPNSIVTAHVYRLAGGRTAPLDTGSDADQYLSLVKWTRDPATVALMRLDRLQRDLDILLCDAETGHARVAMHEHEERYIEDGIALDFLEDGRHFIVSSERDGWRHLYLYDMSGAPVRQLTRGEWDVTGYIGHDARTGNVYYQSAELSPVERQVWRIGLDGSNKTNLTPRRGTNAAIFSGDYRHCVVTFSDALTPPLAELRDADGRPIKTLIDNAPMLERLSHYAVTPKELIQIPVSAGVELNAYLIKPPDFDPNRQYPLVMTVYGGPNAQQAMNAWSFDWTRYLADQGFIVACADNRGTGARGEAFRKLTYGQLFRYETDDQIDAAKRLGRLPYIDAGRIAMFGWSFGGSMALSVLLRGADTFKAAIAVAPVTSYRYYDTIYTERFMDLPQNNPAGYDDWAPLAHAAKLQGKLLLVHGLLDDNVHPQNSMEMIKAFIAAGRPFDLYMAPNKNHGIGGPEQRAHLYAAFVDFLNKNL